MTGGGPEVWAGVESSYVGVNGRSVDQLTLTGVRDRPEAIAEAAARLAARAARCPVVWGWPDGCEGTDWAWAERAIEALAALGIRPIIELLHHGSGPRGTTLLDRDLPVRFAAFAAEVARRFPSVRTYLPINEPLTTARFAGLYGWWEPHARDHRVFVGMLLNQCLAVREAARAVRATTPGAAIVVNEDVGRTTGTVAVRAPVRFDNARRWLTFDLLTGRLGPRHALWRYVTDDPQNRALAESLFADPEPPDVLGIDYYVTSDRFLDDRLERYPPASHGGDGRRRYADVELVRAHPGGIGGFRRALGEAWRRYRIPVALTEVHLDGPAGDRAAWWDEGWAAARSAARAGIPVLGVTAWAILGAAGWDSLLTGTDLAYAPGAFDGAISPPSITAEGEAIGSSGADGDARRGRRGHRGPRGWWRLPSRMLYPRNEVDGVATREPGDRGRGDVAYGAASAASPMTSSKSASQRGTTTSVA